MTLNKVKSDITSVFNTLKNMDLTVDNNGEYSIATQVDLDLATRYPTRAKVTPHLAYLYNTRAGWAQYIDREYGILQEPINQFVSFDGSYHTFTWLNSDKSTRNGLFLECKSYSVIDAENHIPFRIGEDPVNYMKNHLNDFSTNTVKFYDDHASDLNLHVFSIYDQRSRLINRIGQSHMSNLPQVDDGSYKPAVHDDGVTKVGLQPLKTMSSNSGAVIGSTNQYIQMNNNMTILIYTNKLVYIQKLNNSYDYKVYTYPQMNLIKTGTENSLRDVYIKNNLTRTGLIGPSIKSSDNDKYLFLNGFILDYSIYGVSHIIDVYSMVCPEYASTNKSGISLSGYSLIYYV